MFEWIRRKVRNAVLLGIGDAVEYLEGHGASHGDDAERLLEERVKLLPAQTDTEGGRVRRGKSA